ncbi:WhiB family transcriptional regulator [Streptomyces sp. NPDC059063]|uniref:WhiB family transcriptional regulator n=1 Tax=unclassified Streptomyces TaxID=2593676 RepID=UPI0036754896
MTTTARAGATTAPAAGPRDWEADALCAQVDPDLWHPAVGAPVRAAKRICAACPALADCRAYALARPGLTGIWGGLTTRERGRLREQGAV